MSVWLLDKRALSEMYAKDDVEELLALVRKDPVAEAPPPQRPSRARPLRRTATPGSSHRTRARVARGCRQRRRLREKRRSKRRRDRSAAASSSSEPPGDGAPPSHLSHLRLSKLEIKHGSSSSPTRSRSSRRRRARAPRVEPRDGRGDSAGGWKLAGGLSHAASMRGESGDAMFHPTPHTRRCRRTACLDPYFMPKLIRSGAVRRGRPASWRAATAGRSRRRSSSGRGGSG